MNVKKIEAANLPGSELFKENNFTVGFDYSTFVQSGSYEITGGKPGVGVVVKTVQEFATNESRCLQEKAL